MSSIKLFPETPLGSNWRWVTRFGLNRSVKMTFSATGRDRDLKIWDANLCSHALSTERTQKVLKYPKCHHFLMRLAHIWVILYTLLRYFSWWNYVRKLTNQLSSFSHVKALFFFLKSMPLRNFSSQNTFKSRWKINQVKDCRSVCFPSLYTLPLSHNLPSLGFSLRQAASLKFWQESSPKVLWTWKEWDL